MRDSFPAATSKRASTTTDQPIKPVQPTLPRVCLSRVFRDRGFWLQTAIQLLVIIFLGLPQDQSWPWNGIPTIYSGPVAHTLAQVALYVGLVLAFVGLLVQRYRFSVGLHMAAIGAALLALSGGMVLFSGFVFVCFEAYQVARHQARNRGRWFALLLVGSFAAVVYSIVANHLLDPIFNTGTGSWWRGFFTLQSMIVTGLTAGFIGASISAWWQFGASRRRQAIRINNLQARAELAALTERNRIAREMHDVVAHSLTVVIAQADGGRFAARSNPQAAIDALTTISAVGRDALSQMRGLLSVLHDGSADRDLEKLPGLESVARLIEESEASGLKITRRDVGEPQELGDSKGLTVFRVVQECLTNTLKHAGAVPVDITFDWGVARPKRLVVTVLNEPGQSQVAQSGDGSGRGLEGIRQRAGLYGGSASWGLREGKWQVRVDIPL